MNALIDQFGDKLAVLGVPSNQFGHQTNENDAEFPNTLKYVRPGGGFEFKGELFACSKVNGALQVCLERAAFTLFDTYKGHPHTLTSSTHTFACTAHSP